MSKKAINIVRFKRDLRLRDHAPLIAAIDNGLPTLLIYCFKPSIMELPQSSDYFMVALEICILSLSPIVFRF